MQNAQTTSPSSPSWDDGHEAGGTGDWETTYRLYADRVRRWAARLAGPALDVDDVVHEVFLVVHDKLPEFRGDAKLTTWLYRITERVVYGQARRQRLRRWTHGAAAATSSEEPDDVAAEACPHTEAERRQSSRLVYEALDELPHKHRTAVILHEIEGLSGEEIAGLMDTKLSTVWVWLHRGRTKVLSELRTKVANDDAAISDRH